MSRVIGAVEGQPVRPVEMRLGDRAG